MLVDLVLLTHVQFVMAQEELLNKKIQTAVALELLMKLEQLQQEEQTKSGIILPDSAQEKPKMAKVLAVGTEVKEVKE